MKTIKFAAILMGLIGMIAGISCDKALDEEPISTIPPDQFWKDKNDATNWMAGIYNSLQTTLRTNWFDWGEVRSNNVRVGGTGNAQLTMITNTLSANDADINGTTRWTDMYTTISLCNYGIKYFPPMIDQNLDAGAAVYREFLGNVMRCVHSCIFMDFAYGVNCLSTLYLLNQSVSRMSYRGLR